MSSTRMDGGSGVGERAQQQKNSRVYRDLSAAFLFHLLLIDSSPNAGQPGRLIHSSCNPPMLNSSLPTLHTSHLCPERPSRHFKILTCCFENSLI